MRDQSVDRFQVEGLGFASRAPAELGVEPIVPAKQNRGKKESDLKPVSIRRAK